MAPNATRMRKPTHNETRNPNFSLVGSAASSAWISSLMSAKASLVGFVRLTLLTGDPRVDDGEQEVEDEVDQHDGHGHEQGDALHHGVVVLIDGRDQLIPQSGHLQQELDDECAGDEAADGDAGA